MRTAANSIEYWNVLRKEVLGTATHMKETMEMMDILKDWLLSSFYYVYPNTMMNTF